MKINFTKFLSVIMIVSLLLSVTVFGAENINGNKVNWETAVNVDGKQLVTRVGITNDNEITFKLRELMELLGFNVIWNGDDNSIELNNKKDIIKINVGANICSKNGNEIRFNSPVFIENNYAYLPQSFLKNVLGVNVVSVDSAEEPSNRINGVTLATDKAEFVGIDSVLKELAAKGDFSGTVLVSKDNEILFKGAYGYSNIDKQTPIQIDTKFNLGSINKSFTAVAISQLEQSGKLSYNDTVETYLPEFKDISKGKITIRELLNHTSGLGNFFANEDYVFNKDKISTVKEMIPYIVNQPLVSQPNEKFNYSNSGYIVLGAIIEKISGQDYYDYIVKNIFEPAGMINSGYFSKNEEIKNLAIGYTRQDGTNPNQELNKNLPLKNNSDTLPLKGSPAGGGYSTVEDMLRYINALKNDKLLKNTFDEILKNAVTDIPGATDYGFGISNFIVNGKIAVGHNGGAPGINAHYETYLDTGYSIVVLSNIDDGVMGALQQIRNIVAPKEVLVNTGDSKIKINGKSIATKVQPMLVKDKMYIPVDEVSRALGAKMRMTPDGSNISISLDGAQVNLEKGKSKILVNGLEKELPSSYERIDGASMVPVEFFSIAFGFGVEVTDGIVKISTLK